MRRTFMSLFLILFFINVLTCVLAADFYIATDGSDDTGDGSPAQPWATITFALDCVPDDSVILVQPGTYEGRVRIRGSFATGVSVRSEVPYRAILRHSSTVITAYAHAGGCSGITRQLAGDTV